MEKLREKIILASALRRRRPTRRWVVGALVGQAAGVRHVARVGRKRHRKARAGHVSLRLRQRWGMSPGCMCELMSSP